MVKVLDIVLLGALSSVASAIGNARIVNNCPFPVTITPVGNGQEFPSQTLARGSSYGEPFTTDSRSTGRDLKVTVSPGTPANSPHTVFGYTLAGSTIWYNLSDNGGGHPFQGHRLLQASGNPTCPRNDWPDGVQPSGNQVRNCDANSDVTLTLCA
ncbi:hypothetical protein L249_0482 [Ophiocordyceps polyrhachis-furcata BCC 54312]|uniref:Bys1 family protein n=1 Tax=Ophiocordyceps polyrhachis-furcata BCC 54312 TaxID=1330021 RepID=A0A367LEY0_9HYPO|nr:hypothetical protein L249_0482 [Ophiocordyceps polyrhachis-furcata BCC 54312]